MATGIAIMGFGGGALIASAVVEQAMLPPSAPPTSGIAQTFLVHGIVYAIFMSRRLCCWCASPPTTGSPRSRRRRPRPAPPAPASVSARATRSSTPQFWLLWVVLCFNVTAGIGILEKAAPMLPRTSSPDLRPGAGHRRGGRGFVAMLSLANMLGRFIWSSASDMVGRKNIYRDLPRGRRPALPRDRCCSATRNKPLIFLIAAMLILSFYGGGFATVPAYLKDLFGTYQVGAIHGRLLTAWSAAGVLGPLIVNAVVDGPGRTSPGPPCTRSRSCIMIALLAIGFVANELIRPVDPRHYVPESERGGVEDAARLLRTRPQPGGVPMTAGRTVLLVVVWLWVVIPFLYGVWSLLQNVGALF